MGRKLGCGVCSGGNFQLRKDSWDASSAAGGFQEEGDSSRGHSALTLTGRPGQRTNPSGAWLKRVSETEQPSVPPRSTNSLHRQAHWEEEESRRRQGSGEPRGKGQRRVWRVGPR